MTSTWAKVVGLALAVCALILLLPIPKPASGGPEVKGRPAAARDLDEAEVLRWLTDHPEAAGRIIRQLQAPTAAKDLQFEEVAPTAVPHASAGVVAWENRLYVWSGYSTEGRPHYDRTTALEIFDGEKKAWRKGADLPDGRSSMGCFALNGKIYSIGGEASPSGTFTSNVYRYDPATDKWTELKPFPASAWAPLCAVCAGKAYVISGRRGYGGTEKDVYVYDEEKDVWQKRADIPTSIMEGASVTIEDRIYVFGGVHGESESERSYLKTLQIYDTAKDEWITEETPVRMYCPQAVKYDGEVWLFPRQLLDESGKDLPCPWAFRYSPVARRWTQYRIDKPESLSLHSLPVVVDGRVYFTEFYENGKRKTKICRLDLRTAGPGQPLNVEAARSVKKPAEPPAYGTTITFTKVTLNDKPLDADRPTITVKPGDNIAGKVEFHVNRLGPATSIFPVAGTVSWDRTERVAVSRHLEPGEHDVRYTGPLRDTRRALLAVDGPGDGPHPPRRAGADGSRSASAVRLAEVVAGAGRLRRAGRDRVGGADATGPGLPGSSDRAGGRPLDRRHRVDHRSAGRVWRPGQGDSRD